MRALLRAGLDLVSRIAAPSQRSQHGIDRSGPPWRLLPRCAFTASRVVATVYEDVRNEMRKKRKWRLVRLGLRKRYKRKRHKSLVWKLPCELEAARPRPPYVIGPYADLETWPRKVRGDHGQFVARVLNRTLF